MSQSASVEIFNQLSMVNLTLDLNNNQLREFMVFLRGSLL